MDLAAYLAKVSADLHAWLVEYRIVSPILLCIFTAGTNSLGPV